MRPAINGFRTSVIVVKFSLVRILTEGLEESMVKAFHCTFEERKWISRAVCFYPQSISVDILLQRLIIQNLFKLQVSPSGIPDAQIRTRS